MGRLTLDLEYVTVNCGHKNGGCGLEFAMTEDFYRTTKQTGQTWYCPKGHPRVWGDKTDSQKLEEERARSVHLTDQLRAAVRDAEASRVELLRARARFANGVCPCCNRYFDNVARHMRSQHPDQVERAKQPVYRCSCPSDPCRQCPESPSRTYRATRTEPRDRLAPAQPAQDVHRARR